jgi:Flp pilus assembly protein TadB
MFACFKSPSSWLLVAAAAALGLYLVIWHGVHLAAALPFIVLLACPLLHVFMHGGHRHNHGGSTRPPANSQAKGDKDEN